VKITKVTHKDFGKCVKMENGLVELLVTVDFGPRIIHCSRAGKENIFYEDPQKKPLGDKLDAYDDVLRLCGGHRLWISPEVMPRCYYPDKYPVETEEVENGMRFIAPAEKVNNIRKSITVKMADDEPLILVEHQIENVGHFDIELAPWGITMFAQGATEIVPIMNAEAGYLPNRQLTLWSYTDISDPRLKYFKDFITLSQDPSAATALKIGLNNESGWAAVFNKGQAFLKFFEPNEGGNYPDGGCTFETYTNGSMLESETLGEMVLLEPGEFVSHAEEWEVYEAELPQITDNESIRKLMTQFTNI